MPSAELILASLGRIANEAFFAAVVWHAIVAAALLAYAFGVRASPRAAALAASVPLVSLAYLWGSPMGLIPCPTLSLVIALSLLGMVPARRAWSLTLSGAGVFYALFGVVRLGVTLDVPLFLGAVALAATAMLDRPGWSRTALLPR